MGGPVVRFRPHMTRIVAFVAAVVCVLAAVALAVALSGPVAGGPELFGTADRVATIGLGLVGAVALLSLARPLVEADEVGVRVRNIVGGGHVPWSVVRAVRFDRRASCAALELHDDDQLAVQAIQVVDKRRALAAVQALRQLHAAQLYGEQLHGEQATERRDATDPRS